MTVNSQRLLLAAAGAAGAAEPGLYVDDVFSCVLWDGHVVGGEQDIDAGIDLTEGGLVWAKARDASDHHYLVDSELGKTGSYYDNLATSLTGSVVTNEVYGVETFNNNGFTVDGSHPRLNDGSKTYVSWVFKETPGFFDIVKYTGNSTAGHNVAHDLGSVPGCILIKKLGSTSDWYVYHRELGNTKALRLNDDGNQVTGVWNSTTPTSTHFTLANHTEVNESGQEYIAYIFAHDDQSFGTNSDEAIIKCGTYEGNATTGNYVDVGFEPQWLMIKNADDSSTNWVIFDSMRGFHAKGSQPRRLSANSSDTEANNLEVTREPRGFSLTGGGTYTNSNNHTFVYVAIRRPHKPPESATDVFAMDTGNSSSIIPAYDSNFPVDFAISRIVSSGGAPHFTSRLTGTKFLRSDNSFAESSDADYSWDSNVGWGKNWYSQYHSWMFRRAPEFFDVVTYTGNGSARSISHNLTVPPELLIVKNRTDAHDWFAYAEPLGNGKELSINLTGKANNSSRWQYTTPTSTAFYVSSNSNVNAGGSNFIAYLFATLPGISKVGSYTGTGSDGNNVDCGFTNGARFVMVKRTDSSGDWFVADTSRGINAGSDPFIKLNTSDAENNSVDWIDAYSAGFTINGTGGDYNASGGTYLFLAIA